VVPLSLLRNRVFAVATTLSFIVGFALFGAVTFLPLFFQTVDGTSPTTSGLRLAPMMGGLLVTSVLSGRLISRIGHYKAFPVIGTATVTLAMVLLSKLDVGTNGGTSALYLLVLGLGLGSTMQVLVLAVQNAVDYKVLGSATSSVTLARGIGGSLGTAIFGAVFSGRLRGQLHGIHAGALGRQMAAGVRLTGHQVATLPPGPRSAYEHAYANALSPVFKVAAGVAAAGFLVSLLLEQRPLRATAATSQGLEDALAAPKDADSLAEIDRALGRLISRERRRAFQKRLAAMAGVNVSPGAVWTLARFETYGPEGTQQIARDLGIEEERIASVIEELRAKGLAAGDGVSVSVQLTLVGRETAAKVIAARRRALEDALADQASDRPPEVHALLERLSQELAGDRP
jgi:DNA-binding MarR family transcriptional regulator